LIVKAFFYAMCIWLALILVGIMAILTSSLWLVISGWF